MKARVLVVDDEAPVRFTVSEVLRDAGFDVTEADSVEAARELAPSQDVIVTDLSMPGASGLDLLAWVRAHCPEVAVLLLTARGNERLAVQAMKQGAWDYLAKPFANDELSLSVERAAERVRLRRSEQRRTAQNDVAQLVVGEHPVFTRMLEKAARIARRDINVLLQGETGTGKEAVASLIHAHSARRTKPLIRFNCAAVSESLAEAELFGYEKGAFTGATRSHDGFFRRADGGTLVLDEIYELPGSIQSSLLRALQQGEVQPLGARSVERVDVRVIACTHAPLERFVAAGKFRADLFYRLNVVEVTVPPLRERASDIPLLARHFQLKYADRFGLSDVPLPEDLIAAWQLHPWPGNVRELENTVAELLALSNDGELTSETARPLSSAAVSKKGSTPSLRGRLESFERDLIREALAEAQNNQSQAARLLGTTRTTLIDKMKRLGIKA
ncbi:MAG TPA: sigma-54 dependent transcriptional regulator [Polyangiaceae bacterium]